MRREQRIRAMAIAERRGVRLAPEEFRDLPDGTELLSIFGERVVKGRDDIDDDTRYGYAYGVREPEPQRAEDAA
jgi:hypothetical protein